LTYDPSVLSVSPSDITLGSLPSQGSSWQISSVVDAAKGQIAIEMYSLTPILVNQAGSLVNIGFHLIPGASVSATAVQLGNSVAPNGRPVGLLLADTQGALILSPGMDRLEVETGLNTSLENQPARSINSAQETQVGDNLVTETSELPLPIVEANDGLAVLSNGIVTGETIAAHTVPAGLVMTGALAFQTIVTIPGGIPVLGQQFLVNSLPLVNTVLSASNPQQIPDRLFLALARGMEAPLDLNALTLSQDHVNSLIWEGIGIHQDWLTVPSQEQQADSTTDSANQSAVSDQTAVVDQVFLQLVETDDFSDFGDY